MRKTTISKSVKSLTLTFVALFSLFALSCEKVDEKFDMTTLDFTAELVDEALTYNSATVEVSVPDNATLYYTYYQSSNVPDQIQWKELGASEMSITFDNLDYDTEYTVELYVEDDLDHKTDVQKVSFTTASLSLPTVTVSCSEESGIESIIINIEVEADVVDKVFTSYNIKDTSEESKEWSECVAVDGCYSAEILTADLVADTTYVFECYAQNLVGDSEVSSVEFTPSPILISNIEASIFSVHFDVEFDEASIDGICYEFYEAEDYADGELESEYWKNFMIENGTVYRNEQFTLKPNTEYILAYASAVFVGEDEYEMTGAEKIIPFKTADYQTGLSSAEVPFTITLVKEMKVYLDLTNKDLASKRAFVGAVPTADVTGDLGDYLYSINWFDDAFPDYLSDYDYDTYEVIPYESESTYLYDLLPGVEYTIFTIAIDLDYKMGTPITETVTTIGVEKDSSIKANISCVHTGFKATFDIDMNGAEKVYYRLVYGDNYSDDDILIDMYEGILGGWQTNWSEDCEWVVEHLLLEKNYKLYTLATSDSDDIFGDMQILEFSTVGLEYTAEGTIDITPLSVYTPPYTYATDYITFSIALGGDYTAAYTIVMGDFFLEQEDGTMLDPTLENYLDAIIKNSKTGASYYRDAEALTNFQDYGFTVNETVMVCIPLAADGSVGQPVLWSYTDDIVFEE